MSSSSPKSFSKLGKLNSSELDHFVFGTDAIEGVVDNDCLSVPSFDVGYKKEESMFANQFYFVIKFNLLPMDHSHPKRQSCSFVCQNHHYFQSAWVEQR